MKNRRVKERKTLGRRNKNKAASQYSVGRVSKKQVYSRLLIYPLIIGLFIIATRQMQQQADWVGKEAAFQFHFINDTHDLQTNYDVKFYHLHLNLELDFQKTAVGTQLIGANKIVFKSLENGLREIVLNFSSLMKVDSIPEAASYNHNNNLIKVQLAKPLSLNQLDSITVYYRGWPKKYHGWSYGFGLSYTLDADSLHHPWITTMNPPYGAQTWFPCKDDPADKADSVKISVVAPKSLSVYANGHLKSEKSHSYGKKETIWLESYPIATYLVHLNIGHLVINQELYKNRYGEIFSLGLVSPDLENISSEIVLTQLKYMLEFLEQKIAPYPFPESKLFIAEYPGRGGMENQNMIAVERLGPTNERLIMHELAHQWFGASVTPASFSDVWITEGLCNYLTALYLKEYKNISAFNAYLNEYRYAGNGNLTVRATNHPDSVYNVNTTYRKATWFFYMLHQTMGDRLFWESIAAFYRTYAYQSFDYSNFKEFIISYSGVKLDYFFEQWVRESVVPDLLIKLIPSDGQLNEKHLYKIFITQRQNSKQPFQFPLEILFIGDKDRKLLTLDIHNKTFISNIQLPFYVDEIRVDPMKKLLFTSETLR